MGIAASMSIGSMTPPQVLRSFMRRGILLMLIGVIVIALAFVFQTFDIPQFVVTFDLILGIMDLLCGGLMIATSVKRRGEWAFYVFILFVIRSLLYVAYYIVLFSDVPSQYVTGNGGWIYIALRFLFTVAYLYYTFTAWQKLKSLDNSGYSAAV